MKKPRSLPILSAAAGLAFVMTGCDSVEDGPATTGEGTQEQVAPETTGATPEPTVTSPAAASASPGPTSPGTGGVTGTPPTGDTNGDAAVATAVAAVAGSAAIEVDYSSDRLGWEVELISGGLEYEVLLLADGSEVLEQREKGPADEEDRLAVESAAVPLVEAISTAHQVINGNLSEASLEDEDDRPVWEVEIRAEDGSVNEVIIDAVSGERIR
ncbi:PepSY domain-containing protein [Arthrobacter crystallopoietes]|uniref:PepSY domain-containing protein n=1 Tax=Crystallibacter crystallopoietes TaxID=37928 RepID=UPI001ABEA483|nr:PepSY domain-containing protein [Arthrobacter crystallopoietes]QTG79533.1 PepSY domain-containing protein [Arthrobacter crystallopoietes]